MKKRITIGLLLLCLTAALAAPASALEYTIDAPGDPDYGKSTSIEPVATADGGAQKNEDVSKNAALIPPTFGSPSADTKYTGEPLTPNLTGQGLAASGGVINGTTAAVVEPGSTVTPPSGLTTTPSGSTVTSTGFTEVTSDLYYSGGYLGTLKIPTLGVNVKVYEGTGSSTLAKGAGHFEDTSIWDGNCCIAGHNRGTNCYFGEIHTLNVGDKITLTTKLGTRTYSVTSVSKVSETDNSMLAATTDNCITLITCVRDQSAYRWCVRAVEV